MNIKKIQINNLFHTFTHKIGLNKDLTIIMGENGVGKTVTLKLIDAVFNQHFDFLAETDFESIILTFTKERWIITKEPRVEDGDNKCILSFSTTKKDTKPYLIDSTQLYPKLPPHIVRINDDKWYNRRSHMIMSKEYIADRYPIAFQPTFPEWMSNQFNRNHVRLINTQRLFINNSSNDLKNGLAVELYSEQLSKQMQEVMSRASFTTADLDRTFPKRLVKLLKAHKKFNPSKIISDLTDLETKRKKLSEVGLLKTIDAETIGVEELDEKDTTMLTVMHQYVQDSQQKLKQYDRLYNRISLFSKIIDFHFKRKIMRADSSEGFVVYSIIPGEKVEKKEIPLKKLSSGEQNELVLFYELLFKCDDKDLILIDEPEISLHLEWLQTMVNDLRSIVKENKSSLLIATHSPDFIGENYDLVQNLG